jgi:hypothetical protein
MYNVGNKIYFREFSSEKIQKKRCGAACNLRLESHLFLPASD